MTEALRLLESDSIKAGLLMESAQTQQRLAESQLESLRAHMAGLDAVVRDEIRRTLLEEFNALDRESRRTVASLQSLRHSLMLRWSGIGIALAMLCAVLPGLIERWTAPTNADVVRLVERRDVLVASIKQLEHDGAAVEWHRCGETARLCVRVDLKAPTYGSAADFYVPKGY